MDRRDRWEGDDDELLEQLARVLSTAPAPAAPLDERNVVAAGRAAFCWRTVQAELDELLTPVASRVRPSTERARQD